MAAVRQLRLCSTTRRPILAFAAVLLLTSSAGAQDCEQLQLRWRNGNYGLKASTGWPRRPNGETLPIVEVDAMLAGLRRQILSLYSQFHAGHFVVEARGGAQLGDLVKQIEALQGLYQRQPTPLLAEQIRSLRVDLRRASAQLHEQVSPLQTRYEELQVLCRKARSSLHDLLQQQCGSVPGEGYELTNWESLPPPPEPSVPPPPPGLELGLEPAPEPTRPPPAASSGPLPETETTPGLAVSEADANPLWAELEAGAAQVSPTVPAQTEPEESSTPAPGPGEPDRAEPAASPGIEPTGRPAAPRSMPTSSPSRPPDREREAFLSLLATPDEEEGAAASGFTQTWGAAAEPSPAATPASAEPPEGLVLDPNQAPVFRETTIDSPASATPGGPGSGGLWAPFPDQPRAPSASGGARPLGPKLLYETFSGGLGLERIGGTWSIPDRTLHGVGTVPDGESLYVLSRDPWINFELDMDLAIDGGSSEAGLVLRSQSVMQDGKVVHGEGDLEDAYLVRVRANRAQGLSFHDSVDVALRQKGKLQKVLCGTDADIQPRHWHKLAVRVEFSQFDIRLEGKPILSCRDDTLAAGGTMLRLAGSTEARFDNVQAHEIPADGSDLPSPDHGVQVEMPGSGESGWGRLGGRFERLGGVLFGEAGAAAPAMVRRDLAGPLQEAGLEPGGDVQLQVEVRSVGKQGGAGLLVGVSGGRYYAAVLGPSGDPRNAVVQLLQLRGDTWEALGREAVPLDVTWWHRVALVRRPDTIEVQVDGRTALRGRASLPPLESFGIYADPGARILADRLLVASPP
jgi:hypothetical protein